MAWRVEITLLDLTDAGAVAKVEWHGVELQRPSSAEMKTVQISVSPGQPVLLSYREFQPTGQCDVLGDGLTLSLRDNRPKPLVHISANLVAMSGAKDVVLDTQHLKVKVGQFAEAWFDGTATEALRSDVISVRISPTGCSATGSVVGEVAVGFSHDSGSQADGISGSSTYQIGPRLSRTRFPVSSAVAKQPSLAVIVTCSIDGSSS
jgi:hypothetical protein